MVIEEKQSLTTVTLDPLKLVSLLIKAPFLESPAAYALIKARKESDQLTAEVKNCCSG